LHESRFQFEWDEGKAATNIRKHGVSFDLACTIFSDSRLLTIADLEHSETEERWFSIGCTSNGTIISVAYLWSEPDPETTIIRIISARKATKVEMHQYQTDI
jgi:uncharacterized protein